MITIGSLFLGHSLIFSSSPHQDRYARADTPMIQPTEEIGLINEPFLFFEIRSTEGKYSMPFPFRRKISMLFSTPFRPIDPGDDEARFKKLDSEVNGFHRRSCVIREPRLRGIGVLCPSRWPIEEIGFSAVREKPPTNSPASPICACGSGVDVSSCFVFLCMCYVCDQFWRVRVD